MEDSPWCLVNLKKIIITDEVSEFVLVSNETNENIANNFHFFDKNRTKHQGESSKSVSYLKGF